MIRKIKPAAQPVVQPAIPPATASRPAAPPPGPVAALERKPQDVLTPQEAAAHLGITVGTLQRWRSSGAGPSYLMLSRRVVRYRWSELVSFLDAQTQSPA